MVVLQPCLVFVLISCASGFITTRTQHAFLLGSGRRSASAPSLSSSSSHFHHNKIGNSNNNNNNNNNQQSTTFTSLPSLLDPGHYDDSSSSHQKKKKSIWRKIWRRLDDTIEPAGVSNVKFSGIFGRIKQIHNPITYGVLALYAVFRYDWCFRSPFYWFMVAFLIKWYRARYVFKIPVWDRQPNWNNIITSKDQEKDLKAYTCKNCGSTIFIAKSREFFFEGGTGIGGLGCFSCGAKGKDNFVMDRDRIVEDVADEDDYFEYERPLDFVSRGERKKLLKEAKGDEELANQLLIERSAASETQEVSPGEASSSQMETKDEPAAEVQPPAAEMESPAAEVQPPPAEMESPAAEVQPPPAEMESPADAKTSESDETSTPPPAQKKDPAPTQKKDPTPPTTSPTDDDDLDLLDMDDI